MLTWLRILPLIPLLVSLFFGYEGLLDVEKRKK